MIISKEGRHTGAHSHAHLRGTVLVVWIIALGLARVVQGVQVQILRTVRHTCFVEVVAV